MRRDSVLECGSPLPLFEEWSRLPPNWVPWEGAFGRQPQALRRFLFVIIASSDAHNGRFILGRDARRTMTRDLAIIQEGCDACLSEAVARPVPVAPRLEAALSRKLKILSFFSVLIILFNHATNYAIRYGAQTRVMDFTASEFLQRLVQEGLGRVNRSMFFFVAGFLFFWSLEPCLAGFMRKFRTRFVSLLVPFLIWSLAGMAVWLALAMVPGMQHFFGRHAATDLSPGRLLHVLLLDPVPYQLWFIRDLMVWVLLSPLIHLVVSRLGWYTLIPIFLFWLSGVAFPTFGLGGEGILIFKKTGFCFFCVGAVLAHQRCDLARFGSPHGTLWLCAWVLISAWYVFLAHHCNFESRLVQQLSMVAGMMALWINYDRLPESVLQKILPWSGYTFFIYVFHEPLLTGTKKLLCHLLPMSPATSLLSFLLVPPLIALVCLAVGSWLKTHFQRTYGVLTGGR